MAVCAGGRDLLWIIAVNFLYKHGLLPSEMILPNRNRFIDFKQLRIDSRKSFHKFTQLLLAHQITKVFISKQCENVIVIQSKSHAEFIAQVSNDVFPERTMTNKAESVQPS